MKPDVGLVEVKLGVSLPPRERELKRDDQGRQGARLPSLPPRERELKLGAGLNGVLKSASLPPRERELKL